MTKKNQEQWKQCRGPGCEYEVWQDPTLSTPREFCSNACKSREFYWRTKRELGVRPATLYGKGAA